MDCSMRSGRAVALPVILPWVLLSSTSFAWRVNLNEVVKHELVTDALDTNRSANLLSRSGVSTEAAEMDSMSDDASETQQVRRKNARISLNQTVDSIADEDAFSAFQYSKDDEITSVSTGGQSIIFKLVKKLGQGGFGEVWEVGRRVEGAVGRPTKAVLKIIPAHKWEAILEQEVALQARVHSDYVIKVQSQFVASSSDCAVRIASQCVSHGDHYIELEYAGGGDLMDKITDSMWLWKKTIKTILRHLALGLQACHQAGVAHLDIKPENVVISGGKYKLIDFGLSKSMAVPETKAKLTGTQGTPEYMAPEIIQGLHRKSAYKGAPADVWALGVVMHTIMEKSWPFSGRNDDWTIRKILNDKYKPPSSWGVRRTDLMTRMLDKNPKTRITIPEILAHEWLQ